MANDDHKKTDDHKTDDHQGGINPAAGAAIAGAVVGAGVAVAATMAMQNPDNRKKVQDAIGAVKDHASEYLGNLQNQAEDTKNEIAEKVEDAAKKAQK